MTSETPGALAIFFNSFIGEAQGGSERDGLGAGGGQSRGLQLGERGAENIPYLGDALEKAADPSGAKLRGQREGQHFAIARGDG